MTGQCKPTPGIYTGSAVKIKEVGFNEFGITKISAITSKENIANQNIASHDREKATSALAAMESVYSEMFKNISANSSIPAAERNKYNAHIGNLRDSSLNLVEQMYDIDLDWGQTETAQV